MSILPLKPIRRNFNDQIFLHAENEKKMEIQSKARCFCLLIYGRTYPKILAPPEK